jgi:hypothetical protein
MSFTPPTAESTSHSARRQRLSSGATESARPSPPLPAESPTGGALLARKPAGVARRHRRWWPWGTLAFIVIVGLAGKSYFDAQELKTAATQERVTAEQVMQATAREIATTAEEIQQAHDRAAKADVRARELARNTARQMERIQLEMEAAVAEARREGEEQARKQLAPQ